MSKLLYLNNVIPQTINFNGAAVSSVYYNNVLVWSAKAQILENPSAVIFASSEPFTMEVSKGIAWNGTMEYSIDGGQTWSVWSGETITAALLDDNYQLMFRGTGNTFVSTVSKSSQPWTITGSKVECVGNIENLLDYQTVAAGEHPTMAGACYSGMFRDCVALTDASRLHLPATTLTINCYNEMFKNCSNLAKAPKLPATTLEQGCYQHMFSGCSSLTTAPKLPATTVAITCYYYMFNNCDSLINIPDLPATTLLSMCYQGMFYGCDSIKISETKTAECPNEYRIPSSGTITSYKDSSLRKIFGDDIVIEPNKTYYININITADDPDIPDVPTDPDEPDIPPVEPDIPDIPDEPVVDVNTLLKFASSTTFSMEVVNGSQWNGTVEYSNNGGSTWVTWSGESITATNINNNYQLLFRGTGNTYISNTMGLEWSITGSNVKVSGNIENLLDYRIVAAGRHPAMVEYCFALMFSGCSALTDASGLILPVNTSAYCCYGMFESCNNLIKAPILPAITLANHCYYYMFKDCSSLTEAPELPATTLAANCYTYMFVRCSSLTEAPELPATTLSYYCYGFMFDSCENLIKVPELPATTLVDYCYCGMFQSCYMLKQLPKLPATTLARRCYLSMFNQTGIIISETKTTVCSREYRIPSSGTIKYYEDSYKPFETMFGVSSITIEPNTTYYTNATII